MAEVDVEGLLGLLSRYGYLLVFLAGLAEALPLLGWLVPGQAIIILAGAAAAAGVLDIWIIILVAIPAGIMGDAIGFYIGRHYGRAFLERYGPRLRIGPKHLARSDALFAKYGAFALVVARFSFLTRAVGPILAGMARMPGRVFWPVNVLGAVAWSISYGLLGYSFGVGFLYLQGVFGRILALTVVGVIGLYVFYRVLKRYASQFTRDDLYVALVGAAGGAVFGLVADRIEDAGAANVLDVKAAAFTDVLSPLARFYGVVDPLTSFAVLGVIALLATIAFAAKKRWWDATLVALGVGGIIILVETLRAIFKAALPHDVGQAFPSDNAAIPLVLAGVATYLVAAHAKRERTVYVTAIGAALFATMTVFTRLAGGVEYPSAALGGLALGTAWLCTSVLIVEFRLKR